MGTIKMLDREAVLEMLYEYMGFDTPVGLIVAIQEMPYFDVQAEYIGDGRPMSVEQVKPAPSCSKYREGDEFACYCGRRWGVDEERPACPHGR